MSQKPTHTLKVNISLGSDLWAAMKEACERNDTTASREFRAFCREYIRNNAQRDLAFKELSKARKGGYK